MENRGALRFVAGTPPRQPHQRRQSACSRDSPCAQPRGHSTAAGGLDLTPKPDLSRRAVPTLASQARSSQSHHRRWLIGSLDWSIECLSMASSTSTKVRNTASKETANSKSSSSERRPPNSALQITAAHV